MEYASGISIIVKNAGIAILISEKSISLTLDIISTPTYISAPAAADEGMNANTGRTNIDNKNNADVVSAVSPVLPPAATPVPDSTKVVTVEVPSIAPAQVAIESESIILLKFMGLPFASRRLALEQQPSTVPIVSNISIIQNERITTMTVSAEPSGKLISWNAAKNEPPLSVLNEKKFLKFSQNAQVTPSVLPAIISKFATALLLLYL